ncbi:T9SS type A sorting domain-containing protein [uncultured Psychroserpens sp.]|uniref:T9SS type A sorting domain-containing protein n=1 Tax=uncultured Psychroserpens sp. TaxID=255436 RepID=UPI002629E3A0|nr:T9SS type A sorting domain-containing protein [uncultured Psychroserpens sp.]
MKTTLQSFFTLALIISCSFNSFAQISYEGNSTYGRLDDVTYDLNTENTLYAVSLGNHIMKSIDNGINWEVMYSFPESGTQISDLRLMGNDTLSFIIKNSGQNANNTIYFFDLNTQNISQQITAPNPGLSDQQWVTSYDIYNQDPNIILFAQGFNYQNINYVKVFYTTNAGSTWSEVYFNTNYDSVFINKVAIHPNNPGSLYMSRNYGPNGVDGGLFVSNDAGGTWTEKLAGIVLSPITFNPQNASEMLLGTSSSFGGGDQNLYHSLDNGDTWQPMTITWTNLYDWADDDITRIEFNPTDANKIIVLDTNEMIISSDGGATWTNHIYPLNDDFTENPDSYFYGLNVSFNPFNNNELMVNANYHPFKSTDGGVTLEKLENPFFLSNKVAVSQIGSENLYYGVQGGLVHKDMTTNLETAHNIIPLNIGNIGNGNTYFIDRTTEGRVYSFTSGGFGNTLLNVSNEFGANPFPIYGVQFDNLLSTTTDPSNNNIVWASFQNSGTYKIDFSDPMSPTPTQITLPESGLHWSTAFDGQNPNTVFVSVGTNFYKSSDNGATWELKSDGISLTPNSDAILDIKQNPNNNQEIVIATTQGIFKTTDYAENWTQVYIGDNVTSIKYSGTNHLAASIYSSPTTEAQILVSKNNADTWIEIPVQAIENVGSQSMDFTFDVNSVTVYIATPDLGIMTYNINTDTLSTPDNEYSELDIKMYPNPAKDILNIQIPEHLNIDNVSIFSATGQKVNDYDTLQNINVSSLSTGLYFVRIQSGKTVWIKRLSKL